MALSIALLASGGLERPLGIDGLLMDGARIEGGVHAGERAGLSMEPDIRLSTETPPDICAMWLQITGYVGRVCSSRP